MNVLGISEAASMALHAMVLLVNSGDGPMKTKEMADRLRVSSNHLSKVLQRLARVGFVESIRGRNGGYELARAADRVTLGDVYQAIDGPIRTVGCLFAEPVCRGKRCVLSDMLVSLNEEVRDYLSSTKLSDLTGVQIGDE